MRCYGIERSTSEWRHLMKQIDNGNKAIRKHEQEAGRTLLDTFMDDVKQALEHDDNHFHTRSTTLPERMTRI